MAVKGHLQFKTLKINVTVTEINSGSEFGQLGCKLYVSFDQINKEKVYQLVFKNCRQKSSVSLVVKRFYRKKEKGKEIYGLKDTCENLILIACFTNSFLSFYFIRAKIHVVLLSRPTKHYRNIKMQSTSRYHSFQVYKQKM